MPISLLSSVYITNNKPDVVFYYCVWNFFFQPPEHRLLRRESVHRSESKSLCPYGKQSKGSKISIYALNHEIPITRWTWIPQTIRTNLITPINHWAKISLNHTKKPIIQNSIYTTPRGLEQSFNQNNCTKEWNLPVKNRNWATKVGFFLSFCLFLQIRNREKETKIWIFATENSFQVTSKDPFDIKQLKAEQNWPPLCL
jgi:hypothetical protein